MVVVDGASNDEEKAAVGRLTARPAAGGVTHSFGVRVGMIEGGMEALRGRPLPCRGGPSPPRRFARGVDSSSACGRSTGVGDGGTSPTPFCLPERAGEGSARTGSFRGRFRGCWVAGGRSTGVKRGVRGGGEEEEAADDERREVHGRCALGVVPPISGVPIGIVGEDGPAEHACGSTVLPGGDEGGDGVRYQRCPSMDGGPLSDDLIPSGTSSPTIATGGPAVGRGAMAVAGRTGRGGTTRRTREGGGKDAVVAVDSHTDGW